MASGVGLFANERDDVFGFKDLLTLPTVASVQKQTPYEFECNVSAEPTSIVDHIH